MEQPKILVTGAAGKTGRTFADFMRNPLSRGYNPGRLDRELRFPKPPVPRLAMANEDWKVEHGAQFAQRLVMECPPAQRTLVRDSA
jgi:hypothetical protein